MEVKTDEPRRVTYLVAYFCPDPEVRQGRLFVEIDDVPITPDVILAWEGAIAANLRTEARVGITNFQPLAGFYAEAMAFTVH